MTLATPGMTARIREQIYDHVFATPDREVGGVLVGSRGQDGLVVRHIIPALEAEGDSTSLTFTHEAWAHIHAQLDREQYRDQEIVGWYHSHPGHGIFLSEDDLFIHRHFFGDPTNVAYVIDPQHGREGMFGWQAGEIVKRSEGDTSRRPVPVPRVEAWIPARGGNRGGYPIGGYLGPAFVGLLLGGLVALAIGASTGSGTPVTTAPAVIEVAPPEPARTAPAASEASGDAGVPPGAAPRNDTDRRDFSSEEEGAASGTSVYPYPPVPSGGGGGGSKSPESAGGKGAAPPASANGGSTTP